MEAINNFTLELTRVILLISLVFWLGDFISFIAEIRAEKKEFCRRYCILRRYFESGVFKLSKKDESRAKKCKCK